MPPDAIVEALATKDGPRNLDSLPGTRPQQFAQWVKDSGADLTIYGNGAVETLGGIWVLAHGDTPENWDNLEVLTPAQASEAVSIHERSLAPAERFQNFGLGPRGVLSRKRSVNYFFKTRDGALGVLQLVGTNASPPGMRIRYKLAERAAELAVGFTSFQSLVDRVQNAAGSNRLLEMADMFNEIN
jgi:hypothetical protein